MKALLNIKDGNKAPNVCIEVDMTPEEYDYIRKVARHIEQDTSESYISVYSKSF